jgi:hypothetical protein
VIRRLRLAWPDARPFAGRAGRPLRLLAVSDEREAGLAVDANRSALGPVDAVIGCGDLEPDWLAFLADAFSAPLVFVRGNHDRGSGWLEQRRVVPRPLAAGSTTRVAGIALAALEWPGIDAAGNRRHEAAAWWHVIGVIRRVLVARVRRPREPVLVVSHAAPEGVGDGPDAYHRGFAAYRWLLDRLGPPVWLHGHTTMASIAEPEIRHGQTIVINVTGAVLLELEPPAA